MLVQGMGHEAGGGGVSAQRGRQHKLSEQGRAVGSADEERGAQPGRRIQ